MKRTADATKSARFRRVSWLGVTLEGATAATTTAARGRMR